MIRKKKTGIAYILAFTLLSSIVIGGCGIKTGEGKTGSEQQIVAIAPDAKAETSTTTEKTGQGETRDEKADASSVEESKETVSEDEKQSAQKEPSSETETESAFTPITNDSYEVITAYIKELGFVPTMWSDTWDNWLYVIDDHHANLILIEDPADFPYGNYLLFIAVPLSCEKKVHWDDTASVASLANEAEKMEKDVLYELLSEEEVKEVIASYAR